jgi:acyl-coenzyme A thioesterase PaaI-like protein
VEVRTHRAIDPELCGTVLSVAEGCATVALTTTDVMAVDDRRLVHGGFVFGLADYAAMVAVNQPTVVLAAARVRFALPVVAGETLVAEAVATADNRSVDVTVTRGEAVVMTGEFSCRVPDRHVLER